MSNPKYKLGDLVESCGSLNIGIVIEVRVCDDEMTIPRSCEDTHAYIIRTNKQDIMYFESELKLVS